ncbi:unnamed protein product [Nippostrongylus brasiliensis]|uniref:NADH_dhqG_C domain-containing protein n=1 Tax=Nippostrongylus brasiliensis TaxID=27835 RepID=A0A0N4Y040_NIPBR|nr:unnamed protein product [Nippostrongylus brasiliensis]
MPKQKLLSDFYITNIVCRHSPTMAQATKAALKNQEGYLGVDHGCLFRSQMPISARAASLRKTHTWKLLVCIYMPREDSMNAYGYACS